MRLRSLLPRRLDKMLVDLGVLPSPTKRILKELNRLDLVGRAMKAAEANRRMNASETARRAHPDLAEEWFKSEPLAVLFPDRQKMRDLIADAEADTLHEIALKVPWDGATDVILDVVKHPACDHATAWLVYHFAAPDFYEREVRQAGGRPAMSSMDDEVMEILDVIVARYAGDGFATRRFSFHEDFPPGNVRIQQEAARARGEPLHWELPEAAYVDTEDALHEPHYEMVSGDLRLNFPDWMAARQ